MATQAKHKNSKAPNPFLHSTLWGFGVGIIMQLLFTALFLGLAVEGASLTILLSPYFWLQALQYGGLSGAALGLANGLLLWAIGRNFQEPFTKEAMQGERLKVYALSGALGLILALAFTSLLFWPPRFDYSLFGFLVPFPPAYIMGAFFAAIISAYISHRYLFQLRLWSEAEYGIQDEKAKNVERLEDKPKNDELEDDFPDASENRKNKSS